MATIHKLIIDQVQGGCESSTERLLHGTEEQVLGWADRWLSDYYGEDNTRIDENGIAWDISSLEGRCAQIGALNEVENIEVVDAESGKTIHYDIMPRPSEPVWYLIKRVYTDGKFITDIISESNPRLGAGDLIMVAHNLNEYSTMRRQSVSYSVISKEQYAAMEVQQAR